MVENTRNPTEISNTERRDKESDGFVVRPGPTRLYANAQGERRFEPFTTRIDPCNGIGCIYCGSCGALLSTYRQGDESKIRSCRKCGQVNENRLTNSPTHQ